MGIAVFRRLSFKAPLPETLLILASSTLFAQAAHAWIAATIALSTALAILLVPYTNRALDALGDLSYSLYLTHPLSASFAVTLVASTPVALAACLLAAWPLHRFIERPRIAVCGLNPHAGEHGLFGTEDIEHIAPAVAAAQAEGIDASGPHPADTVFFQAVHRNRYDAIVCMYHDQGHGPMKLLAFESGVNVTLGLPIVRTSVDHGTAFDIAWTGTAFTDSVQHAVAYARRLVSGSLS